jgi:hypothetical protein
MTPVTRLDPTRWCGVLAAATLVASLGSGVFEDLIGGLLGGSPHSGAPRDRSSYGHTHAPDGLLRAGCHNYRYRYVVKTPTSDWTLETFLGDPTGDDIASGAFTSDSDPRRGRPHFRLCRDSTRAGRFTIRALVHWYGYYGQDHRVWLEPSHFQLRQAR